MGGYRIADGANFQELLERCFTPVQLCKGMQAASGKQGRLTSLKALVTEVRATPELNGLASRSESQRILVPPSRILSGLRVHRALAHKAPAHKASHERCYK